MIAAQQTSHECGSQHPLFATAVAVLDPMRRHHFLALHMLELPVDNISLIPGVEADYNRESGRRRSTQLPISPGDSVHRRLPLLFNGPNPGSRDGDAEERDADEENEDDEDTPEAEDESGKSNFLGRVGSYSRLMHAHTKYQLGDVRNHTLPSYMRTMHAFTMNQLNHQQHTTTLNAMQNLRVGGKTVMLPASICSEMTKLGLDNAVPGPPLNTPEIGQNEMVGIDFRKLKRRSNTEPIGIKTRDFAVS